MSKRLQCPHCRGWFREKLDGTINSHGAAGYKYPNCAGPEVPAKALCTGCRRTFADAEGFTLHRYNGSCLHPSGLGLVEKDGIWSEA